MARLSEPSVAERIASDLREDSSDQDMPLAGPIFGHATIATLVALKGGRRVAAELADLDPRWFKTGALAAGDVIRAIEEDDVAYYVAPNWFYLKDKTFKAYLRACYDEPRIYPREEGSGIPRMFVFAHLEERPCLPADIEPSRATDPDG